MISQNKPLKIAIVAYNLEPGGLSNVIVNVFKILQSVPNYQVKLLLLDDIKQNAVENEIVVFNTSKGNQSFFQKVKKYSKFRNYLHNEKLDFIINLRYRINPLTEILVVKFLYPKVKTIYNIHSSKLETYLPKSKILAAFLYGKSDAIVCASKGIEDKVMQFYHFENTTTIYNPIDLKFIAEKANEPIGLKYDYILAVGRIEEVKQFDKLIEAYAKSELITKNIKLVIVGEGTELEKCKQLTMQLNIVNEVVFIGYSANPFKYMKEAKFVVLSSKYEGFPMVVLEALACNTPVISFDLQTGPNEIITHGENGLLVENQSFDQLTLAMNSMVGNKELLNYCNQNAQESVEKFSKKIIKEKWLTLLNT